MAVYTETINLAGDFAQNAAKAEDAVLDLSKSFESSEAGAKAFSNVLDMAGGVALKLGAAALDAAVGMGKLVAKGFELALSAADAKGDMILLFDTLGDGVLTGQEAVAMLDKLGTTTGLTREKLGATAQAFAAMGVTGVDQLEKLTLAAVSAGAMAKGGGEAFEQMFRKISTAQQTGQALKIPLKGMGSLASMGLKVDDVAKQMGLSSAALSEQLAKGSVDAKRFGDALTTALVEKGAGPVADGAEDIGNMWAKAKENVSKFFEDVDIGPFVGELKKLFGILDSGSSSGQALKAGVGVFFKEVFALATKALPVVREMFLGLIIYGLKAYIAMKPVVAAIKEFAASETAGMILTGLVNVFRMMAIAVGVVAVVLGVFTAAAGMTIGVLGTLAAAITMLVATASTVLGQWVGSASKAASDFVQGLVQGIQSGAAAVVKAVTGLADAASAAFRSALDINSPSGVMMAYGANMGDGVVEGVDASASKVAKSATGMAAVAVEGVAAAPPAAPSGGGGGGVNVTVEPGAIVIQGGGGEGATELTEQAVAMIFERVALAQGLA